MDVKSCLFGTSSGNCAGYCKFHRAYVTVKQIRAKNCLGKQCHYLQKNYDHEWWAQRDRQKQKRLARKEKINKGVM